MNDYDLGIIGWGAAGFAAAIRASELTYNGMRIALIGNGDLGGTCVNVGCVPSKYLIEASKEYNHALKPRYPGISSSAGVNFHELMSSLRSFVLKSRENKYTNVIKNFHNIDLYRGKASFISKNEVMVNNIKIRATNFIIATGSRPYIPENIKNYITSDDLWSLDEIPKRLAIIGSGAVAMEMAYAFSNFGSDVYVFNRSNHVLKNFDSDINKMLIDHMKGLGVKFIFGDIKEADHDYVISDRKYSGFDKILAATSRVPNIDINLEAASVDYKNGIIVDDHLRTSNKMIYAAGDCVDQRFQLETLAGREGVIAVENILGLDRSIDLINVPWAVFTEPNVASTGYTERELKKYKKRVLYLKNVVKSNILMEDGLVKMLTDDEDHVLGVQIFAPYAAEFIPEAYNIIKNHGTYKDFIEAMHVFPTVSESLKITAQSFIRDVSMMSCCME
ncbi:mercuric reductase [Picrophilus oshimae]|uniref:Mercuric reductase n=1 Tax=Picrophilus torridus (strain ATCC 700027 / DSM 9790 / JCM 10055 / NBRC 100828 / KAW 2/3) TaxID=1122961 RepID=Q6L2F3_PICTO|nr:mercuric reductase [Picrophilus oshimae]AAT42849.1 mercuric reductase [Picrophilus oshimae DSM 9789]